MAACLRRFCWRPRIATVWSLCPTFKVTSLILMCRGYKPEALMCSPCTPKIPKAKVKQSPCTLLQSRKQKSIQLDQHTVQIRGKKWFIDIIYKYSFFVRALSRKLFCAHPVFKIAIGKKLTIKDSWLIYKCRFNVLVATSWKLLCAHPVFKTYQSEKENSHPVCFYRLNQWLLYSSPWQN